MQWLRHGGLQIRVFVTAAILGLLTASAWAQSGPALGMVFESTGTVQIERGGSTSPSRLGELLYEGDRMMVASGQASFIFCPTQQRIGLASDTVVELTARTVRSVSGSAPGKTPTTCVLPQVALGSESLERFGGMRARGGLYPPLPLYTGGLISQSRPVFHWRAMENVESFVVTLTTEAGDPIWEHRTSSNFATYPDSMPELKEQNYNWALKAETDGQTVSEETASFTIKKDASLEEFDIQEFGNTLLGALGFEPAPAADDPDDPGTLLLEATQLENKAYYAEAAGRYRRIRDQQSSDSRLTRRLAWLYSQAGLSAAANDELERLQ